jgi:predicted esterase
VVALHGYGEPPEAMAAYARSVAPPHAVVIAPEGPLAFYRAPSGQGGAAAGGTGRGWVADDRRDEADQRNVRLLDAVWADAGTHVPLDARRCMVMGYSQGVGVAAAWLLTDPLAAGLVALAGGIRVPLRPQLVALARLPCLWVTGAHDRAYPPAYAQEMLAALRSAGVALEHHEVDAGHAVPEPAAEIVRAWLARVLT